MHMHVQEAGGDDESFEIDGLGLFKGARVGDEAAGHAEVHHAVDPVEGVDHARAGKYVFSLLAHFKHPATRKRTAMRTARPFVTC
jgi:hypothetical protein